MRRGFHRGRFHGNFHRLSGHHRNLWRHGRWHRGWHHGRHGWWWLAGGFWYLYNAPIYPYPLAISNTAYGGDGYCDPNDGGYEEGYCDRY